MNSQELAKKIVKILDSKKGMDITGIDIHDLTTIGDYFILVTGTSSPHVKALAEEVEDTLAREGLEPRRIEGAQSAAWILIDYQDVILHIFTKETRDFYDMERLWSDAPRMDLTVLQYIQYCCKNLSAPGKKIPCHPPRVQILNSF
ncbi:MAG: ribosome silencing factor [Angelakisella sp.]|nr:ribosome silencing factor [Angelakisella sp.]